MNNFQVDTLPFLKLEDASKVLPVLKKRLPKSCVIYNAAKMSSRFPDQTSIFVLNEKVDEDSWIFVTHFTENYGMTYLISADQERSKLSKSDCIKLLSQSSLINWNEPHWFIALEKWISEIIFEVSVNLKGNTVSVYPEVLHYMEPEDCLNLDLGNSFVSGPDSIEIKKLDLKSGVDFIVNTWKYSKSGTREVVHRLIERNESGGIYMDNKLICGATTHGYGLLGMLHTVEEHRNKGFAKMCMRFVYKELALTGMIPVSTVEMSNKGSMHFHKKLGCKVVEPVYFICFSGSEYE